MEVWFLIFRIDGAYFDEYHVEMNSTFRTLFWCCAFAFDFKLELLLLLGTSEPPYACSWRLYIVASSIMWLWCRQFFILVFELGGHLLAVAVIKLKTSLLFSRIWYCGC
ncbi:hypothetical protein QQP08_011161 [Theobroma cacao]|nr:hypothetical protein QQP08_011161 [Theobroma cacao]